MALSDPRVVFGVHSITPYRRSDKSPYGIALVVQSGQFSLNGETVELFGGSSRFSWSVEDGDITAELGFSVSEYPNWLFELFGGKAPTQGSAEASGNVSTIVNAKGTSVVAATGIASVAAIGSLVSNLKHGRYVIKALTATSFEVYCVSNVDFGRGTDGDFLDDDLSIHTEAVASATEVIDIANFGLQITMGASVTAMTAGDTAYFDVRPVNTYNRTVKIGGFADEFPEFGAFIYAQKRGSSAVFEIEAYKLKALGLSLGAERKQFSQNEYTAKASYDATENAVCRVTEVEDS